MDQFSHVLLPLLPSAQTPDGSKGDRYVYEDFTGYFYFAPGVTSPGGLSTAHIGAGGEGYFTRNVGVGVDVGYLALFESCHGVGTFLPNIVARFRAKSGDGNAEPFVAGGHTLFFGRGAAPFGWLSGTAHGANFGGGLNHWPGAWLSDRIGLAFR